MYITRREKKVTSAVLSLGKWIVYFYHILKEWEKDSLRQNKL